MEFSEFSFSDDFSKVSVFFSIKNLSLKKTYFQNSAVLMNCCFMRQANKILLGASSAGHGIFHASFNFEKESEFSKGGSVEKCLFFLNFLVVQVSVGSGQSIHQSIDH
jgi:hypothetical protein